ncbi:MAG: OPT/YSL family transporter, partial [Bacillota bacterium]|nr:OPT/YSL family transporter [Bacillota bacterium]
MAEKEIKYAAGFKEQFTLRGVIIGMLGAIIITTSSMYVALKMGALPWPIIFVALVSMFSLKAMGRTNINEINVTHTIMSAGAMVAGGIAFTVPGIWMLDPEAVVDWLPLIVVSVSGVVLGLIFTALIRKYFVETKELPYPMGQAAAETLIIGDKGGKKSGILFGAMGFAAVWTVIRDWFMKIPTLVTGGIAIPGVSFGLYMSPMMLSVGYLIGPLALSVWFIGAIIGDFGVVVGGTAAGFWSLEAAAGIKSSLGMGVMVGTGIGIILKGILPQAKAIFGPMFSKSRMGDSIVNLRWAPIVMVALAFVFTFV